jgi:acetone carboxylase gamma subunit
MLDATVSMSFAVDVREEFTFAFSEWKSFVVVLVASDDDVFFFLFLVVLRFRVSFREIIDVFRVANNIVFAARKGKGKATKTLKTKPKKDSSCLSSFQR